MERNITDWRMHYFLKRLINEKICFTRDILRMRNFTTRDLFKVYKTLRIMGYDIKRKELSVFRTSRSGSKKKGGRFLNNNGSEVVYYI